MQRKMTEHAQVASCIGFPTGARREVKKGIIVVKVRSTMVWELQ